MKKVIVALALLVSACAPSFPSASDPVKPENWSYGKGPHGENCLFYRVDYFDSAGHQQYILTMTCDTVKP